MSSPQHHVLPGSGVPVDPQVPAADWDEPRLLPQLGATGTRRGFQQGSVLRLGS